MDDVIESKVGTRIQEEQQKDDWLTNYTHQDALLLNLERACQAAIDAASHIVRVKKLGFPKSRKYLNSWQRLVFSQKFNPIS